MRRRAASDVKEPMASVTNCCGAEMKAGVHVTLPTYVNYKFNIAVGLDGSTGFDELYGQALSSCPRRDELKLCNGKYSVLGCC